MLKSRITTGWNFTRALFLVMGITILIQGAMIHQLMGIALGLYFTSMAVFGFGCAGGACYTAPVKETKVLTDFDVEFEEIKKRRSENQR